MSYSAAHWRRVGEETRRMVAEVPLYRDRREPPADPAKVDKWLAPVPPVGKRELRRGFPKALVREHQDLHAAMRNEQVTLLATSGTTSDRLQVIWEWSWWDPQEREAMRLNARIAKSMRSPKYREAVLTTPACGAGTCHFGSQTAAERNIDGILFFNESADPTHWTDVECDRMLREWCEFAPRGVEADPAYLAIIARAALARGMRLPSPEFITLTYETTTRAMRRDIGRAFDAPVFQLYGATEAGVLFMECEYGRLHPNERHSHVDLVPRAGVRRARSSARHDARPRLDAAAALRHRRRRASRGVARLPVRARERRPIARAHRRPTERLLGRRRRDRDTADARRRDPCGARRRGDARAMAAFRRHLVRRR